MFITPMRRLICATALGLVVAAPSADAQERRRTVDDSPHLWATVNICDTRRNPDTIGIRASMPGSGKRGERMFMRFRVQFFSEVDQRWHNFLAEGSRSGWVGVGPATYRARQSGWSFPFDLEPGQRFELRGAVSFEWRRGSRVVRRAAKRTTAGHRTSVGDPRGYSAATCVVRG